MLDKHFYIVLKYKYALCEDNTIITLKKGEMLPKGAKAFQPTSLHTMYAGVQSCLYEFELDGKKFKFIDTLS